MELNDSNDAKRLRFLLEKFNWSPGQELPEFDSLRDEADFWDHASITEVPGLRTLSDKETDELFSGMREIVFAPDVLERMARNGISVSEVIDVIGNLKKSAERD